MDDAEVELLENGLIVLDDVKKHGIVVGEVIVPVDAITLVVVEDAEVDNREELIVVFVDGKLLFWGDEVDASLSLLTVSECLVGLFSFNTDISPLPSDILP